MVLSRVVCGFLISFITFILMKSSSIKEKAKKTSQLEKNKHRCLHRKEAKDLLKMNFLWPFLDQDLMDTVTLYPIASDLST